MLLQNTNPEAKTSLENARRFFSVLPLLVFLLTLMLFSSVGSNSYGAFLHALCESLAVSLTSVLISIAAYGFYKYLTDRSPGL